MAFYQMKMINQMRKAQNDLKKEIVEVEAGDGAVVVQVTGELKVKKITIDPTRVDTDDASKIFLHNGKHIIQYDFTFPALSLWHHRYDEELPDDFNWNLKESIIFSKNVHNQIDTFMITSHSLKNFWNYFSSDHSLLESLEYSSNQPNFDSSIFIPQYTDLLAWLSRHQLLRSI